MLVSSIGLAPTHAGNPIYTVSDVVRVRQQQPTAWTGQTITVRGAIIWIDVEYRNTHEQMTIDDGCTANRYPTVTACQRSLTWTLARLRPGSIVRLILASQAYLFTYNATFVDDPYFHNPSIEDEVAQNPPSTLVVRFNARSGTVLPAQGPYHVRLGTVTQAGQAAPDDGLLIS